jgi:hypothetical protein
MSRSDWTRLPTSGLQVLVLEDPDVLESNPSWTVVLCQLCSDKRLVTLRWFRKNGKPFPSILNQTGLIWETLEVSGDFVIHTFMDGGYPVQKMSVVATEVKIFSSDEPIHDGCVIRVTSDEEERIQRDLRNYIKYLRMKIAQKSYKDKLERARPSDPATEMLTEKLEKLSVSSVCVKETPEDKKSPVGYEGDRRGSMKTLVKSVKGVSVAEKWAMFEQKGGWVSNANTLKLPTKSKKSIFLLDAGGWLIWITLLLANSCLNLVHFVIISSNTWPKWDPFEINVN